METILHRSTNIVLRGIHLSDILKPKNVEVYTNYTYEDEILYTSLPQKFESVSSWPHFSDLKCWHCDQFHNSFPKFVPRNMSIGPNYELQCDAHGHFCTWSCVISYIMNHYNGSEKRDSVAAVRLIAGKFNGGSYADIIQPAPEKTIMSQYIGQRGISSKEYNLIINQT